jgi:spore germination protein KB
MNKELITNKQGSSMISFFIIGSTLVIGVGLGAKQDAWLATIIGALAALPMIGIYARILSLFPEKNAYEILQLLFGKAIGKIMIFLFAFYGVFLGALILRNFMELAVVVALQETPELIIGLFVTILTIWVAKEGIEVLGRFSQFTLVYVLIILLIIFALSFPLGHLDNLRPMLYDGISPVLKSAFGTFSFPFAETVCFMFVLTMSKDNKPYKMFYKGWAIGGFFVVLVALRNVFVLGGSLLERIYFPSHVVVSLIDIGDFLERIESTVAVVFFFGGFVKSSICLLSACHGVKHLLNLDSYRPVVVPLALLTLALSVINFENTQQMYQFVYVYPYFVFPFQVILPIIIWIFSEIKAKKLSKAADDANVII